MKTSMFLSTFLATMLSGIALGQSIDDPDPKSKKAPPETKPVASSEAPLASAAEIRLIENDEHGWGNFFGPAKVLALNTGALREAGLLIGPNVQQLLEEARARDELLASMGKWLDVEKSRRLQLGTLRVQDWTVEVLCVGRHSQDDTDIEVASADSISVTAELTWTIKNDRQEVVAQITSEDTEKATHLRSLDIPIPTRGGWSWIRINKTASNPREYRAKLAVAKVLQANTDKLREFLKQYRSK